MGILNKIFRKEKQKEHLERSVTIETLKRPETECYHVGLVFASLPPSLNIITEYGDNGPALRELRLSLSVCDWNELEKQPFYSELKKWVCSLESSDIQESNFQIDEEQDLSEIELYKF